MFQKTSEAKAEIKINITEPRQRHQLDCPHNLIERNHQECICM